MVVSRNGGDLRPSSAASAVIDFLNSRAHGWHPDLLDDPETASDVALIFSAERAEGETIPALRAAREALYRTVTDPAAWPEFSDLVSGVRFRQRITTDGTVELEHVDGNAVLGAVALSVAELIREGNWNRLKLCANDYCTHAFYDSTRNRMQRWDSYETCGNRTNVAAHRARRRDASPPEGH